MPNEFVLPDGECDIEEWEKVLDTIAYGFMFYNDTNYSCNSKIVKRIRYRNLRMSFKLLEKYFENMWD